MRLCNPLAGIEYERAWGPGGGTHAWGQNWQSANGWDLLHSSSPMHVRAPFAGVVKSAGPGGVGRFAGAKVGIEGDGGMSCFLTHLSRLAVELGQRVAAGDAVGVTGSARGVYHLHFALVDGPYVTWSTTDPEDARLVDPRGLLDSTAKLLAPWGPKGYPLYRGNPFAPERPEPPDGNTLRLDWITAAGQKRRAAGWGEVEDAMSWFAVHGHHGGAIAIAWRGSVWRGWQDVRNVWSNLERRFLG